MINRHLTGLCRESSTDSKRAIASDARAAKLIMVK